MSKKSAIQSGLPDHVQEQYPDLELERVLAEFRTAALQLKLIQADDVMFMYAAKDIFTARTNLRKWQKAGLIDANQIKTFEKILQRINREKLQTVPEDHPDWDEKQVGRRVLTECNETGRSQQFPNLTVSPPLHTAEGVLQMLANDKRAGWAAGWEEKLPALEEWEDANAKSI